VHDDHSSLWTILGLAEHCRARSDRFDLSFPSIPPVEARNERFAVRDDYGGMADLS
jgi:hypothetical protein